MEKTESNHDHLTRAVPPLAALISLIINIVTASVGMSPSIQWIVLPSTIVITVCCVYVVFERSFVMAVRGIAKATKHRRLVPGYFDRFETFVTRLQELCNRCYCDTVPSVLRDFPPLLKGAFRDLPALDHLAGFAAVLHSMLAELPRTKQNLLLAIKWFDLIMHMYDQQCVCEPVKDIQVRLEQGIDDDKRTQCDRLRRKYQDVKFGYIMFREQYAEFARDVNNGFGEAVARIYYERPSEL